MHLSQYSKNMFMLIDSHAHLTSSLIKDSVEAILQRAKASAVGAIINICTDEESLEKGLALAEHFDWVFNAAATTPHDVESWGEAFFPRVEASAQKGKLVAIGETGLDYFYEHASRALQKASMIQHLALAKKLHLPVVFHCRDAFEDLFAIADEHFKGGRALMHCFTGNEKEASAAIERGWSISFSGILTYKKSEELRKTAKQVPISHILLETDTPYLAPQSRRGSPNEPAYLVETAHKLAEIKKISFEEVAQQTSLNAIKFFSLAKLKLKV